MKYFLKYPLKLGDRLYEKGIEVRRATLEEVQEIFPGMTYRADSVYFGIWLPDQPKPTVVLRTQLVCRPREDVRVCENCGAEGVDGLHESVCPSTNPSQERDEPICESCGQIDCKGHPG